MSTPNPALVAAAPALKSALTDLQEMLTTILTGDPAQIGLRAAPAVQIFIGKVTLLWPELATAEQAVVLQDANNAIGKLIAKLP